MKKREQNQAGEDVRKIFGERLRELRKAFGVSQEDLALICGLDRSYVGQVERGKRNIALENIHKIARGLDVHPCDLLKAKGENHSVRRRE